MTTPAPDWTSREALEAVRPKVRDMLTAIPSYADAHGAGFGRHRAADREEMGLPRPRCHTMP